MPQTYDIEFNFLSPWHMGSGFGEGAHLDALPVKNAAGLPYIPGRSVKGLFREAAQLAEEHGQLPAGTVLSLFGSRDAELSRYKTSSGTLAFSNATLGTAMDAWATANREAVRQLFMPLAATRIDGNGLADNRSLRRIEVALPVTLKAQVTVDDPAESGAKVLETVAGLIRQAGSHRHRGLGRVAVTVKGVTR